MKLLACFIGVFATVSSLAVEAAENSTPAQMLERGKSLYFENDFQAALDALESVLVRKELTLEQKVQALEYKAFTEETLKRHGPARETWAELLRLRPDFKIDPADADRELIDAFKDVKPEQVAPAAPAQPAAVSMDPLPTDVTNFEVKEHTRKCGVALCLVPFGVGQFVNGRPVKGSVFAGLGALFLAGNIASHYAMTSEYNGRGNQDVVDRYFYAKNIFFGLLLTTAVAGVVDAFVFP